MFKFNINDDYITYYNYLHLESIFIFYVLDETYFRWVKMLCNAKYCNANF